MSLHSDGREKHTTLHSSIIMCLHRVQYTETRQDNKRCVVAHTVRNTLIELNKWFTRCQRNNNSLVFGYTVRTYSIRIAMYLYHENTGHFLSACNLQGHLVQECLANLWFGLSVLDVYMTLQAQRSSKPE